MLYHIINHKDGTKDVKPLDNESADERTRRLQIKSLINDLFVHVDGPQAYRVTSTGGSTEYVVRWVRTLKTWGCTCKGYDQFLYKFPACPCIHVAAILIEVGPTPQPVTVRSMAERRAGTLEALRPLYDTMLEQVEMFV